MAYFLVMAKEMFPLVPELISSQAKLTASDRSLPTSPSSEISPNSRSVSVHVSPGLTSLTSKKKRQKRGKREARLGLDYNDMK
jgi:hypothetical protein